MKEFLEIINIVKDYWGCEKIKYSRSHSKFRYVDPLNNLQTKYSPLHYDGAFLSENKSINICIPFYWIWRGISRFANFSRSE